MTKGIRPEKPVGTDSEELSALIHQQLDAHGSIRERVAALESDVKHRATKSELADVKTLAWKSVAGALVAILIALARFLLSGN